MIQFVQLLVFIPSEIKQAMKVRCAEKKITVKEFVGEALKAKLEGQ